MKQMYYFIISVLIFACSSNVNDISGIGSETTNGLAGVILDQNGNASRNALVYVLDTAGDVVDSSYTNENGEYHFSDLDYSTYGVYAINQDSSLAAAEDSVAIDSTNNKVLESTLSQTGAVEGIVAFDLPIGEKVAVRVAYLPLRNYVYDDQSFRINGLLPGTYELRLQSRQSNGHIYTYAKVEVVIKEGETTTVNFEERAKPSVDSIWVIDDFESAVQSVFTSMKMKWQSSTSDSNLTITLEKDGREIQLGEGYESPRSLLANIVFDNASGTAMIGFDFGWENHPYAYDFRDLRSIQFHANCEVALSISLCFESAFFKETKVCFGSMMLDPGWEKVTTPSLNSPMEWIASGADSAEDVLSWSTHFNVEIRTTASEASESFFMLDDLVFHF